MKKSNELIFLACWLAALFVILIIVTLVAGCDSGWSIAGWEIK